MNLQEFLSFPLIQTSKVNIDVSQLLGIAIIVLVTIAFNRILFGVLMRRCRRRKMEKGHAHALFQLVRYVTWILCALFSLQSIGLNLSVLLAGSAALAVGIGFGMQQIFKDLVSGVFILLEGNIKVGDLMQLDDGTIGRVSKIGVRTIEFSTADGISMIVPNSFFLSDKVINWSHGNATLRTHINVGVAYGSDTDLVQSLLLERTKNHPLVSTEQVPFVRFVDFGDSSLSFSLYFWVTDPGLAEQAKSDLRFDIDRHFRAHHIEIPFPQRDIHIREK